MIDAPATSAPRKRWWRRLRIGWIFLAALLAGLAYTAWREHELRSAIADAKELGWTWQHDDPFEAIRKDWKAAFQRKTWFEGVRDLDIPQIDQIEGRESLLRTLNPRSLALGTSPGFVAAINLKPAAASILTALNALPQLQSVTVRSLECEAILDALRAHTGLRKVTFSRCSFSNLEGLHGFPALESLTFKSCRLPPKIFAPKDVPALKTFEFYEPYGVKDWSAVRGLPGFKSISTPVRSISSPDTILGDLHEQEKRRQRSAAVGVPRSCISACPPQEDKIAG